MVDVCPGLPRKLSSREELCTLLSVAIFTSTVQHAATNNGQVLNTHINTLWCLWMLPKIYCQLWDALVKRRRTKHSALTPQGVVKVRHLILTHSLFVDVFPVWLVCLGSQHPLHHETTPTKRQRCYHGDDHGHPSWYQPVLCADGYHMASRASTTRRSESISIWFIW